MASKRASTSGCGPPTHRRRFVEDEHVSESESEPCSDNDDSLTSDSNDSNDWNSADSESESDNSPDDTSESQLNTSSDMPLAEWIDRRSWKQQDMFARQHGFSGQSGILIPTLNAECTPNDIFCQVFTPEMLTIVCEETNRFARQNQVPDNTRGHTKKWIDTTESEMSVFFALAIVMGITPKPELNHYWSRDPVLHTPFFPSVMPRDRFKALLKNLHFCNNEETDEDDRLFKIRSMVDRFAENFKRLYTPTQVISTDESLWKFKGRLSFKQYNPTKRARFGVKIYKTCQSTGTAAGYTWAFKIYTGEDKSDIPVSEKVVLDLNKELMGKGYTLAIDNWFSSPALFRELHKQKTNVVGTVRKYRKGMPQDLVSVKLKRGEVVSRCTDDGLMTLVWKDKKDVRMLSTMHQPNIVETGQTDRNGNVVRKPQCVITYNHAMGGVDISDQLASTHRTVRKYKKWYKKIFLYLMDLGLVNAFLIYKVLRCANLGGRNALTDFKLTLVKELIEKAELPDYAAPDRPRIPAQPSRLNGRHFPEEIPPTDKNSKPYRRCVLCSLHGRRKQVAIQCDKCTVPLCVTPCFKIYHCQKNLN